MKKAVILLCLISLTAAYADTLNVVWQFDRTIFCEGGWITELLSTFDLNHIDDYKYQTLMNNALVVASSASPENSRYFAKLRSLNYTYGIIIIGDERYENANDFYPHAQFVFRQYWHKKFASSKNVYTIPLGYKTGFRNPGVRDIKAIQDRPYVWSFAGQITNKPTRRAMIKSMKSINPHYIHEIFNFGDPKSLPMDKYTNMLLNSIFAPCPTGWWNLDSYRVYEALECGCIPIVEKKPLDYFGHYFGDHPFITINSWLEVPKIINALLADPVRLEQYRAACHQWWLDYKEKLKNDMHAIIKSKLS